nr:uncharacterized protein LOC117459328 isoform X2 [Pseudochaenichthys georgianus]
MANNKGQTKEESPATIIWSEANKDVDVMYSSVVAVERQTKQRSNVDVTYSTVKKKRKTSGQLGLAEEEVTYSDVKHMRRASEKLGLAEEEVTYSDVKHMRRASEKLGLAEEEVTYSDVKHMRRASEKWSEANRDVDVMSSSVVAVERQTKQRIQAEEDDVTYSRLA